MKRVLLSLAATALTLGLVSAVRADDTATSTPSSTPQATTPASETPPTKTTESKPAMTHKRMAHHAAASARIDLNSATKEQLEKLGVDDATADKIIAARPFKSSGELTAKSLVTKAEYAKIRNRITVKVKKA